MFAETARALGDAGHQVVVLCASDDTRRSGVETSGRVRVHRLSGGDFSTRSAASSWLRSWTRFTSYRRRLAAFIDSLIDRDECDVVVCAEYGAEAVFWAQRPRRVPLVVACHGPTYLDRSTGRGATLGTTALRMRRTAEAEYALVRHADAVCAPSEAMAEFVRREVGVERVDVVPNFVEVDEWVPPAAGVRGDVVLFAGTFSKVKGVFELIDAVDELVRQGFDVRLRAVGRLSSDARAARRRAAHGSRIELLGPVPREQLRTLYAEAAIVCVPSWWEPFGMVCIEAMAAGGLVVASTEGAGPELIEEGVDGFLVEPRDSGRLADRLADVLRMSSERTAAVRRLAQEHMRTKFDARVVVPRLTAYLERVAACVSSG